METTLRILDQVNCKFEGLDPFTRRKIVEATKYFIPYARHTPSYKLGRWDGTMTFSTVGGGTFINILDRVLPIVEGAGYDIALDDLRPQQQFDFPVIDESYLAAHTWPEGHVNAGEPIILRDYQVDAIHLYLENLQSIQEISTGAGKTILTGALSRLCEPYGRTIIIVPNKGLVGQTEEDYRNLALDVGVYYGDRKELGRTHTICTWQSLAVLAKKSKREQAAFPITEFLAGVVCVMVDEVHSAKAAELRALMCGAFAEVPIRWGLTGTIPKEDYEAMTLLTTLGPVVGHIKARELQEQGVLANCHVDIIQLIDDHVAFRNYDDEHDFLVTDPTRLGWIADYIRTINADGNTLIMVTRIETGELLAKLLPESIFVSGDVSVKKRKVEYQEVQTSDNKIIIATYGIAAVGINIPRIFNLVFIEPGKSFIRIIQGAGRGLRRALDKDFVAIKHIASTCRYSARHITKCKPFYRDAEYPFTHTKVDYRHGETL